MAYTEKYFDNIIDAYNTSPLVVKNDKELKSLEVIYNKLADDNKKIIEFKGVLFRLFATEEEIKSVNKNIAKMNLISIEMRRLCKENQAEKDRVQKEANNS
jgi:hypothetical protein